MIYTLGSLLGSRKVLLACLAFRAALVELLNVIGQKIIEMLKIFTNNKQVEGEVIALFVNILSILLI